MSITIQNTLSCHLPPCLPAIEKNKKSFLGLVKQKILFWFERSKQRKQLAKLDDRLLRDIGLTRDQVQAEISKPFWK